MKKRRIVVAMSGGVDSSVAAALLKEKGYEVIGITMKILPDGESYDHFGGCADIHHIEDARRVCYELGIPHYVLNLQSIFKRLVINNFYDEYSHGRTPNPCVRCNQLLKFGVLLHKAHEFDAFYLATGHYARIDFDELTGYHLLKKGVDQKKDQSYFLYRLSQYQLQHLLFPVGGYTKEYIRSVAENYNLEVYRKEESQEICFIKGKNYRILFNNDYLENNWEEVKEGMIIDSHGTMLGKHKGITGYTIGQRRGLGISSHEPLYVKKIDYDSNTITVGRRDELFHHYCVAENLNWIGEKPSAPVSLYGKIRSIHIPAPVTILSIEKNRLLALFHEPQWAITPGQSIVFYSDDTVVGGGIITNGW